MGQDSLSKYFLKGKQNQDHQRQVDLGTVLGRGGCIVPNTELSGPLEQRTRISQEKLGDSSSCSVCRDQNLSSMGKPFSPQLQVAYKLIFLWLLCYPILVGHNTVGNVTWLNLERSG